MMNKHLYISEKADFKTQIPISLEKRQFLPSKINHAMFNNDDLKSKKKLKIEENSNYTRSINSEVKSNPIDNEDMSNYMHS